MKAPPCLTRQLHAIWQHKGLISTLLLPLSWLVLAVVIIKKKRALRSANKPSGAVPVVIVGNLVVGGTGKTPVVIALVQAMQARGWQPGVISRGYGAQIGAQAHVGQGQVSAQQFGDEPALIAQTTQAPLAVHPNRTLALQTLIAAHPEVDLVVSDDGLQHLALRRDIEIVVQDARGTGNGRLLPAGPLREPASKLSCIDLLITNLAADEKPPPVLAIDAKQILMRLYPTHVVHLASGTTLEWSDWHAQHADKPASAVAAIGQPERFFAMLRNHHVELSSTIALPDHDPYLKSPFTALQSDIILVTAKDAVKCARFNEPRVWVVYAAPGFSDTRWIDDLHTSLSAISKKNLL